MGFGKFLLGGLCAVGAVIAAPVVVPAAGLAVAGSLATGAVGTTIGMAAATASTATIATAAGVAAATTGIAVGAIQEKRVDESRRDGIVEGVKSVKPQLDELKQEVDKSKKTIKEERELNDALFADNMKLRGNA